MTKPSLGLTSLLLALFLLGGAVGFAAGAFTAARAPVPRFDRRPGRNLVLGRLDRKLNLRPDQRARIEELLERNFEGLRQRRMAARREMGALHEQTRRDIEALLDPAQRERYRRLVARVPPRWGSRDSIDDGPGR